MNQKIKRNIKTLIMSMFLSLVSYRVFAQEIIETSTAPQSIIYGLSFLSPVDLILIIISGLTAMLTILVIILGLMAFFGWTSAKDFEKKKKEFLIQQKKIIDKGEREMEESKLQAKKVIEEIEEKKDQIKTPADFEKYRKQAEELIKSLENSIKNTEDRMRDFRISTSPSINPTGVGFPISTTVPKSCSSCGVMYIDSSLGIVGSRCPNCGSLNY